MKTHSAIEKPAAPDLSVLNEEVRTYWEKEPCGTCQEIVGGLTSLSVEWFEQIEEHRYSAEPMIHSVAQFSRHHGKSVLEVGVGAGTDHLQWARVGAHLYGVDLTNAAVQMTRSHLGLYGFEANVQQTNAEHLPFDNESFDVVYSWGVIHHADRPDLILGEILRVLKPGGIFLGMMYGRHSIVAAKLWIRHGLGRLRPRMSLREAIWNHVESVGTKAYTVGELSQLFAGFHTFQAKPFITVYDTKRIPRFLWQFLPNSWGWFIGIEARK